MFDFTQFDTQSIDLIHDCVPLKDVKKLTKATYVPRAYTNLYDAIGTTIRRIESKAEGKKVLFVVQTDGQENSSKEWNLAKIKELIMDKETAGWTFSYIGIGPQAWEANATLAQGTQGFSNVLRTTKKEHGGILWLNGECHYDALLTSR